MNILFIGAHPDDLEILCGGTIAKYVAKGHRVSLAVATNGNVGSSTLPRDEIAKVRKQEAENAARLLGAHDFIWLNENDEFLFDTETTRRKFVNAIRRAEADVVITHNPDDYHPDHNACSKLATDARILASVRLIDDEYPALARAPELLYMDSLAGLNFHPHCYVDISETMEIKRQALCCHASQNEWIRTIFDYDLQGIVERQSAFRGLQSHVRYAEGFIVPSTWPRRNTSEILPY